MRERLPITRCSCKTVSTDALIYRHRYHAPRSTTRSTSARVRFSVAKTGNKQSGMYTKKSAAGGTTLEGKEKKEEERRRVKRSKCIVTYVCVEKGTPDAPISLGLGRILSNCVSSLSYLNALVCSRRH